MTALREPPAVPSPTPQRRRARGGAAVAVAVLLALVIGVAILGAVAGQQPAGCGTPTTSAPAGLPAAGTGGQTLQGRVSWFGGPGDPTSGPTTASGRPVTDPGIAVYDTATLNGYWWVRFPNGRSAVLQQTDIGPAPWTGRVLDVLYSALPYIGYTQQDFPTDAQITARYLGSRPQLAAVAVHSGSPTASPAASADCAVSGNGTAASVVVAADQLAAISRHGPVLSAPRG